MSLELILVHTDIAGPVHHSFCRTSGCNRILTYIESLVSNESKVHKAIKELKMFLFT
jgi:hypothetical protein